VNIIGFIVAFVLFVGGIYIMGEAFYVEGLESLVFIGGILVSTIGAAIPIHIMKRIDA
jgi:high-affinity Fe2+/Pb2+ permease